MLQYTYPNPNDRREVREATSLALYRKYFNGQKLSAPEMRRWCREGKRELKDFMRKVIISCVIGVSLLLLYIYM